MKKINLEVFKTAHKKYSISVGFSEHLHFRTKRQAIEFCRRYRKSIETSVRLCLTVNSEIISLYRLHYFHLDEIIVHQIDNNITFFNARLSHVFKGFSSGNSSLIFSNIEKLFDINKEVLSTLKNYAFTHKQTAYKYQLISIEKNLNFIHSQYHSERVDLNNEARYLDKPVIKFNSQKQLKKA